MPDERPVEVQGVSHRFGRRRALQGLSLVLERGEIVGLAGPNGSGKTTLLCLLAGLLRPRAGDVRVFGMRPFAERERVMRRARFAFAPPALFDALTAREHLVHLSAIGLARAGRPTQGQIEAVLELVGLEDRADDRVGGFSFGMRQRLALAQALLPMPELLVLDEPTDGLDPRAVLELRVILRRLRDEHGISVLLSSHQLTEIGRLVDHIAVIDEGRLRFFAPPDELRRRGTRLRLTVDGGDAEPLRRALERQGVAAEADGSRTLRLESGALRLEEASALAGQAGLRLVEFHEERPALEEALLEFLAEERRA